MRACGKLWPSEEAASRSKLVLAGSHVPRRCTYGCVDGWHIVRAEQAAKAVKLAAKRTAPSTPDTFSAVVCAQIDQRDGDDTGAVLVRLCQRCGSTRNLNRHHRRLKQKGGSSNRAHTHCACNSVTVCLACHGEIHDQASRQEMEAEGWIVSQAVDEPGSVGVMRFAAAEGGATQWPSCSGEWLETAPEALEVA